MHIYIKVPTRIAKVLGLTTLTKSKLPDGNYMAMIKQFERLCPAYRIIEEAPKMGCAILKPLQLRAEKDGDLVTPLPEPDEYYKGLYYNTPEPEAPKAQVLPELPEVTEEPQPQTEPQPEEEAEEEVVEEAIVTGEVEPVVDEEEAEEGGER